MPSVRHDTAAAADDDDDIPNFYKFQDPLMIILNKKYLFWLIV